MGGWGMFAIGLAVLGASPARAGQSACQAERFDIVVCHPDKHGNPPPRYTCPYGYTIVGHGFEYHGVEYSDGYTYLDLLDGSRRTVAQTPTSQWPAAVRACMGLPTGPIQFGSKTVMRDETIKMPGWTGEKFGEDFGEPASFEEIGASNAGRFRVVGGGPAPAEESAGPGASAGLKAGQVPDSGAAPAAPPPSPTPPKPPQPDLPAFGSNAQGPSSAANAVRPSSGRTQATTPVIAPTSGAASDAAADANGVAPAILPPMLPLPDGSSSSLRDQF